MITGPLRVSGCVVQNCNLPVAAVAEVAITPAKDGHMERADLALCASHAEAYDSTSRHAPAQIGPLLSIRRALVLVHGALVVDDPDTEAKGRGRWPSYQELVRAAMDRGGR